MSFNIMAESSRPLDYTKIHKEVYRDDLCFDLVPMPTLGINGGDALGICIPGKAADVFTWEQLKPVLKLLRTKFNCDVYDMYGGQKLNLFNINSFRDNLLPK